MPSLLINYLAAFGSLIATFVLCTGLVYSGKFFGAERPAHWAPIITWLWRVTWMLWLVAVTAFVVLTIHYPVNNGAIISPHLPLEEQILMLLALGSVLGGYVLLLVWWLALAVRAVRARSRNRERNATAMRQTLRQHLGDVAVVILALIIVVVVTPTFPFVLIVSSLLLSYVMPH
jgi:hypothetical protein